MSLETLVGSQAVKVTFRDGSQETIDVKVLTMRDMVRYAEMAGDESRLVELFASKDEGWADTLTIESHESLLAAGEELNRDPFDRWLRRRAASMERIQAAIPARLASLMPPAPSRPA